LESTIDIRGQIFCNAPLKLAKPNDILISVRAPVGPTNIADQECCIGRGLAAIRPRAINGGFLFYNLRYLEKYITGLGTGSTFHAINKTQLGSIEVNGYGFSLEEQQGIASVLSLAQQSIEEQERLLQLTRELKKSLLHKLLTGFDTPILYAMYLDKPMRDHTLLQAIARVNRPYENEKEEMIKPHGFVLDFVGIFDKLEKALAFDSDEVNAVVKDLNLLKVLFQSKMREKAPQYMQLIKRNFDDKDVDSLIEHFRDKDRRKEFFKEYKEIEMLYEIISPDQFLRPFLDDYATVSAIYEVVDKLFQRKTNELVQKYIGSMPIPDTSDYVEIDSTTIDLVRDKKGGDTTKVINLIKSIEKAAEEQSDDPYLIAMAERARAVQENFEDRQKNTAESLTELLNEIEKNEKRKKEQAEKGLDGLPFLMQGSRMPRK
jgi:hypothetical protein